MSRCLGAALLVAAAAGAAEAQLAVRSVWDGVFTAEQARRGQVAYTGPCDRCHGYKLDGASEDPDMLPAPPVAGPKFLREWDGRSLAVLVEYVRSTMPKNNPGYLSDGDVVDIVAYMLFVSRVPASSSSLQLDAAALATIVITPSPQ